MQNRRRLSPEALALFDLALADVRADIGDDAMDAGDRSIFELRLARWFQNLFDGLKPVYGQRADFESFVRELVVVLGRASRDRPRDLKMLDFERDITPDWFQRETMLGYVCYVDRFAGDLPGIIDRIDYLEDVGTTYLHLMSCLKPRDGENDGGYAIQDYRAVASSLGDIDDLEDVCASLRARGISVCVDLVLNHCADDHAWAVRARNGEQRYRDYFYMFGDRSQPDAFERTLPEVFPDFAPGNFTEVPEADAWVWTTFHAYQWDLNWSNPRVFLEIVEIMTYLANRGVEVFRLDAVAFMWKRLGTDCQSQPEVHDLLQALRSCSKIAAPAVAHKAEAIVAPDDLIHYFGTGRRHGKVSNIAYHNSLMVQYWSALASRDTELMAHALERFPKTPTSIAWATYLRCHDDIGWAVADEDAAAVGLDGHAHRAFLSDYYAGAFPGSHARGAVFQHNPATDDRRISGSFASLAGLEQALEAQDETLVALAIERIVLGHALICGFGGIPLVYMGDELGLLNDYGFRADPEHASDNRWLHRPMMDWEAAQRRHQEGSVEARIFDGVTHVFAARKRTPHLHAAYPATILDMANPHVFGHARSHPLGELVAVYNFTESHQEVSTDVLQARGIAQPYDQLGQEFVELADGALRLTPYQRYWLI